MGTINKKHQSFSGFWIGCKFPLVGNRVPCLCFMSYMKTVSCYFTIFPLSGIVNSHTNSFKSFYPLSCRCRISFGSSQFFIIVTKYLKETTQNKKRFIFDSTGFRSFNPWLVGHTTLACDKAVHHSRNTW